MNALGDDHAVSLHASEGLLTKVPVNIGTQRIILFDRDIDGDRLTTGREVRRLPCGADETGDVIATGMKDRIQPGRGGRAVALAEIEGAYLDGFSFEDRVIERVVEAIVSTSGDDNRIGANLSEH